MDASEPEVDSSLPQLSNLNSDSIAVEVSVFYNGCSGFVNEFDDIALGVAEVIVIISVIVHGNDFTVSVVCYAFAIVRSELIQQITNICM